MPLGDHRPVVVRHVLGDRGKGRDGRSWRPLEDLQVEIGQILIDAVDQFRLIVKGQADLGEAHQGPREPEDSLPA